jgi:hypothetical protein
MPISQHLPDQLLAPAGTHCGELSPATATGTRITIEPMGEPAGTLAEVIGSMRGTSVPFVQRAIRFTRLGPELAHGVIAHTCVLVTGAVAGGHHINLT